MRYDQSPGFAVNNRQFEVFDGEYLKLSRYIVTPVPNEDDDNVVSSNEYFAGQLISFFRNDSDSVVTSVSQNHIGTTDIPARTLRFEITHFGITPALESLLGLSTPITSVDTWFIEPADGLDVIDLQIGAGARRFHESWIGVAPAYGDAENSIDVIYRLNGVGENRLVRLADALPSHPVTNVLSDFPTDQTTVTTTNAYEVTYDLEDDVTSIDVIIDGMTVETATSGDLSLIHI